MDYKNNVIKVRNKKSKKFDGNVVASSLVVGSVVEAVLRRAYRPSCAEFPVPLVLQSPSLHKTVFLKDVLPPGCSVAKRSQEVKVYPRDAELALAITKDALTLLMDQPYNLEVSTVDHANSRQCSTAHDLCMATRLVGTSCLPVGSYSVEIKCREIGSKTAFDWWAVLTSECMPLWRAQLSNGDECRTSGLRARILILACMTQPCYAGPATIHAAINYGSADEGWAVLSGWRGFKGLPTPATMSESSGPRPTAKGMTRSTAAPVAAARASPAEQWQKLKGEIEEAGEYFKLVSFCRKMRPKLPHGQAKRDFIAGSTAWRLGRGHGLKLAAGTQWVEKSGHRGGVKAVYVRKDVLEQVFYKYYAKV